MNNRKRKRKKARLSARRSAAGLRRAKNRRRQEMLTQRRQRADIIVTQALRRYQSDEQKFAQTPLDPRLRAVVLRRARKLVDPCYLDPLLRLSDAAWLRPIDAWKPRGKSARSLFTSLVRHLLVRYSMPAFLNSVFFIDDATLRQAGVDLFVHLGRGGSLHRFVQNGRLPVPLTKRMCHRFMQSTTKLEFIEALRHAQVGVLGGDRRLAEAIVATHQLGRGLTDNEPFWSTVIQWACNQAARGADPLRPHQIGPIFDWFEQRARLDPRFLVKGRTVRSVLQDVEQWHGELAHARATGGRRFDPSGYRPLYHSRRVRLPTGDVQTEKHCVIEIACAQELAAEGRTLRHCVLMYSSMILRGTTSIWSYRVDGARVLTIEVDNRRKQIVQCRGFANRLPTRKQMVQIERWTNDNGLTIAPRLPVRA